MTFKQWWFIHRARLGLVPLNAYKHNSGPIDKRCRRCWGVETLPHVLNHCMRNSNLYKARHNALLDRIKKAAGSRWMIIGEDQHFGANGLRPDLVIQKDNDIIIVDATVPFENEMMLLTVLDERKRISMLTSREIFLRMVKMLKLKPSSLGVWVPGTPKTTGCLRDCAQSHMLI